MRVTSGSLRVILASGSSVSFSDPQPSEEAF